MHRAQSQMLEQKQSDANRIERKQVQLISGQCKYSIIYSPDQTCVNYSKFFNIGGPACQQTNESLQRLGLCQQIGMTLSLFHSDTLGVLFFVLRFLFCVTGNYSYSSTDLYIHCCRNVLRPHLRQSDWRVTGVVLSLESVGPYLLKD